MRGLIGCSNLIDRTTQHTAQDQSKYSNPSLLFAFWSLAKFVFFKVERERYSWKIGLFIGRK